jgi:TPR repeat protein
MELLALAAAGRDNISRQLGVLRRSSHYKKRFRPTDAKSLAFSGWHFFLLNTLMRGLEKRSTKKCMLKVAQFIASKQVRLVRDKAAKEAEELCASGRCAIAIVPLQRAIDLGDLPSRALMGWLLIDSREGVAEDHIRAFELVEEGSSLGCHHCQGVMARCYRNGYGCEEDEARSLELARESSGRDSRYGLYWLGTLYHYGEGGVAQDVAQALAFYRLAAAQNLDAAQWRLAWMYAEGDSVAKDYAEALRWYQLAAAQGFRQALYWVAYYHEVGRGVPKNMAEAIRWYRCAQAAGCHYAADKLLHLMKHK